MFAYVLNQGLRPARAVVSLGDRVARDTANAGADLAERAVLAATDRLLADGIADRLAERLLEGPELERVAKRAIDSRLLDTIVERLLESEDLWLLVEEIAQSPAVTDAIGRQSIGFADQVAGQVRLGSQRADARLERAARRLLRRGAASESAAPAR